MNKHDICPYCKRKLPPKSCKMCGKKIAQRFTYCVACNDIKLREHKRNWWHAHGNAWRELQALKALPDDQIDTSDIPEVTDWSGAVRGKFYKQP